MTIEWNKVTWYSKVLAMVLFVATFSLAFYFGQEFEKLKLMSPVESIKVYNVPAEVTLSVNQSAKIGDLIITLNSVQNDSRCPLDVQCIQAGSVNTNVTFTISGKTISQNMSSDEVPQEYGKYKISIAGVEPPAYSTKKIDQKDYLVSFVVTE